jgi:transposase
MGTSFMSHMIFPYILDNSGSQYPHIPVPQFTMIPISSSEHKSVISLLSDSYSTHQVASKLGLCKSTVARIFKQMDTDKENRLGGRVPKLTASNTKTLIHQLTTGCMDTAVEATLYINPHLPKPVHPQTVCNSLKKNDFCADVKAKSHLLKKQHRQHRLRWALEHQTWTVDEWKRVLWTDEIKVNCIGSDEKTYVWKKKGEPLSDHTMLGSRNFDNCQSLLKLDITFLYTTFLLERAKK